MAPAMMFNYVLEDIGDASVYLGYNTRIQRVLVENIAILFEDQAANVVSRMATINELNDTLTLLMNILYYIKNTITKVCEVDYFNRNSMQNIQEKAQALTEHVNINEFSAWNLERMETIECCCKHILHLVDRKELQAQGTHVS